MYSSFFGFKEYPFNLTPDPKFLFLSRYHKQALDHLLYGIDERKGFIAITGGIGTGKTTLCRAFISQLDQSTKTALIFNSFISDSELLKAINQEFSIDIPTGSPSKKDYIDALNQFLLENFSTGGNAVLLVDEAQNLSHAVLEQIRMLSNLETEKEKLIQIVLVGQPELKDLLGAPSLRQLDERITVRYDLQPLNSEDIKGYVEHRLVVAGGRGDLRFTKGALKKIFSFSQGNPRRINAVCDRALLIAYAAEKHTVNEQMVAKAVFELRGAATTGFRARPSRLRFGFVAAFGILLIVVVAYGGWTYRQGILGRLTIERPVRVTKSVPIPHKPEKPRKKGSAILLDEQNSLSKLFTLFNTERNRAGIFSEKGHLELVSLNLNMDYHVMFKKPFRMAYSSSGPASQTSLSYVVIREVTDEGATIVDADGNDNQVPRDFILRGSGSEISWFCPYSHAWANLVKGMNSTEILEVQKTLSKVGYRIEATGFFDESTFREIKRFQNDFGLVSDGIVGPQTMALLYLMS